MFKEPMGLFRSKLQGQVEILKVQSCGCVHQGPFAIPEGTASCSPRCRDGGHPALVYSSVDGILIVL